MSGPLVIGPKPPTVNTIMSYSVPPETQAIYVQNYTRYTLLVSFGATAPTATNSLNNDYDGVLAPGGRDTFYVQSRGASPAERRLNTMGAFTGNVFIMPVDRTSALAYTGTISGNNDIWLSAYGPNDPPPPFPGGMPLNVDLSSQPRMISLPPPGAALANGLFSPATTDPLTVLTLDATPALSRPLYLFHLSLFPQAPAAAVNFLVMNGVLQEQPQDSGFVNLGGSTTLMRFAVAMSDGFTTNAGYYLPFLFAPHFPAGFTLPSLPPNTAHVALQLHRTDGNNLACYFNIAAALDLNNNFLIPGYGGSSGQNRWTGLFGQAGLW